MIELQAVLDAGGVLCMIQVVARGLELCVSKRNLPTIAFAEECGHFSYYQYTVKPFYLFVTSPTLVAN